MIEDNLEVQLVRFIELGQQIIALDRQAELGRDFSRVAVQPPSVGVAQPGFMGAEYKGLVILGRNPGTGDNRPSRYGFESKLAEWHRALEKWRDLGSLQAYMSAFDCWMGDLKEWRVWSMYVEPILDRLQIDPSNIAYLNLFQSPTIANTRPTPRMFRIGWTWTKRQLDILAPKAVIAGGKDVGAQLRAQWSKPSCEILVQDRNRSLNTQARLAWMNATAMRVGDLLA